MCYIMETGDSHYHDGEHVIETGNGNHIGVVIELCIAIAIHVFC